MVVLEVDSRVPIAFLWLHMLPQKVSDDLVFLNELCLQSFDFFSLQMPSPSGTRKGDPVGAAEADTRCRRLVARVIGWLNRGR